MKPPQDILSKKEHVSLRVSATNPNGFVVENLRCKVFLPEKPNENVWLVLHLSNEQDSLLNDGATGSFWKFSVKGNTQSSPYENLHLIAENVFSENRNTVVWDHEYQETIWYAHPADLKIEYLMERGFSSTEVRFWLTPSVVLTPDRIIERSFDGGSKIEVRSPIQFTLSNDLSLNFQSYFKTIDQENGNTLTNESLIATTSFFDDDKASTKIDRDVLNEIDDFLLIASFAARQRCVCHGWEAADSRGKTKFFRKDITVPSLDHKHDIFKGVIHPRYFQDFLRVGYQRLVDEELKDLLRDAIRGVMPRDASTVEASFTRMFSALESLVLLFRRQNDLEFVFSEENEWKELSTSLKAWLKEQPSLAGDDNAKKRSLIYENLSGLQRISFPFAFKAFCESYEVDLSDLWDLTGGGNKKWSLSTIRNNIVHGNEFASHKRRALVTAGYHLQWTIERMLLGYFGWGIGGSLVGKDYLSIFTSYNDLEENRELISS